MSTLVTGFPRMLTKLLVGELLARTGERLVLLARPRYLDDARRFVATLAERARVTVLEGDVTALDLGVSGEEYMALAREVTAVHHAAQSTWEGVATRSVPGLNVRGALEVVELARTARSLGGRCRVVAYSSTLVAGDHEGLVREGDLELGQGFRSDVERSLYQAERALRAASRDVPVTVVRPSTLVGHSRTGETDALDGPYLPMILLLGSPVDIPLPLPARGQIALDVVPVDHVARAGVVLGAVAHEGLRTYHVVDPSPLPARRVYELVARAAGRELRRATLPAEIARAVLRGDGADVLARGSRTLVQRLGTRTLYDDALARPLLAAAGVACPPFESYVEPLVEHLRQRLSARRVRPEAAAPEAEVEDPLA